jgi:hypothetical protein
MAKTLIPTIEIIETNKVSRSIEEALELKKANPELKGVPSLLLKKINIDDKFQKVLELIKEKKYLDIGQYLAYGTLSEEFVGVDIDDFLGPDTLDIVREASAYLGLSLPETVQDNTSKLGRMMLSMLNRAVALATSEYDWNQLKFTGIVTTTPVPPLYNPLVDGFYLKLIAPGYASFESSFLSNTGNSDRYSFCDVDEYRSLIGNTDASIKKFTVRNNCICFADPTPSYLSAFKFDYKSNCPIFGTSLNITDLNVFKRWFVYDDDHTLLDEELLIKGVIWNYKKMAGQNYQAEFEDYAETLNLLRDKNSSKAIKEEYPATSAYRFRRTAVDQDERGGGPNIFGTQGLRPQGSSGV